MPHEMNYTATAVAREALKPTAHSPDGRLDLELSTPEELGGAGGEGTNAEQLLAAGYAACLLSALRLAALQQELAIEGAEVTCDFALQGADGRFTSDVSLRAHIPSLTDEQARAVLEAALKSWPYAADRHPAPPRVELVTESAGGGAASLKEARQEAADGGGYA